MKMASSKKRIQVGSVCKAKEAGKPHYIKMRDGKTYRLESAKFQLESLEAAVKAGKLTEEIGDKVRERIQKIPEWVVAEIVEFVDKD